MPIKRRSGQARPVPVTNPTNRRPPGTVAPEAGAVEETRSAASIFKSRLKADQAAATLGLKKGLPFSIGPVQPVHIRPINAMFYGDFGFGKTTLAASANDVPSMNDVLFINVDEGTMSITSRRTMDIIRVSAYDQIARIFEYLSLHQYYRDAKPRNVEKLLEYEIELKSEIIPLEDQTPDADGNTDPERTWFVEQRIRSGKPMDEPYIYNTVIIDTISELHRLLVYKFTGIDLNVVNLSEEVEKMDSWQEAQEMFRLMVRAYRTLRMHTILLSSQAIEPSERNKRRNPKAGQALPKLAGQMAGDVASFVDMVGYLELIREEGQETRRLYLGAGYADWISKHRFENLPGLEFVDNPTMQSLIDLAREDATHGTGLTNSSSQLVSVASPADSARTATPQRSRTANAASGSRRGGRAGGNGVRRRSR